MSFGKQTGLQAATQRVQTLVVDAPDSVATRGLGAVVNVAVFCLVLLLACFALSSAAERMPHADLPGTAGFKQREFRQQKHDIDLVFVGSSHVFRQFDPAVFERVLGRRGPKLASYNFGLGGMRLPETLYTVDWILAQEPERLKVLLIELQGLEPQLVDKNHLSLRQINWHSPHTTRMVARVVWNSKRDSDAIRRDLWVHGQHLLYKFFGIARLSSALKAWLDDWSEHPIGEHFEQGFLSLDRSAELDPDARDEDREEFLGQRILIHRRFRTLLEGREAKPLTPLALDVIRELTEHVRAAGIEPVFVLTGPNWSRHRQYLELLDMEDMPPLVDLNDPERYPEFYEFDNLYDIDHVNAKGAYHFSRALARDYFSATGKPAKAKREDEGE